jgi:thiol-disulfide isomerase/thioredoxin
MTAWKYYKLLIIAGIYTNLFIIPNSPISARPDKPVVFAYVMGRDSLKVGNLAPSFVMRDLFTDSAIFMRDFTGKTLRDSWKNKNRYVVVLSFLATWCEPCKIEIPLL